MKFWEDNLLGGKPLAMSKFFQLKDLLKENYGEKVSDYVAKHRKWKKY